MRCKRDACRQWEGGRIAEGVGVALPIMLVLLHISRLSLTRGGGEHGERRRRCGRVVERREGTGMEVKREAPPDIDEQEHSV